MNRISCLHKKDLPEFEFFRNTQNWQSWHICVVSSDENK